MQIEHIFKNKDLFIINIMLAVSLPYYCHIIGH